MSFDVFLQLFVQGVITGIADYQAGDMVVHSPYLVHVNLNNTDPNGRMRLSTDISYQRKADPIDVRWQNHWHDDNGL